MYEVVLLKLIPFRNGGLMNKNIQRKLLNDIVVFNPQAALSKEKFLAELSMTSNLSVNDFFCWNSVTYYGTKTPLNKLTNIEMLSIIAPHIFHNHVSFVISRKAFLNRIVDTNSQLMPYCYGSISQQSTKDELQHCINLIRRKKNNLRDLDEMRFVDLIDLTVDENYNYDQAMDAFLTVSKFLKDRVTYIKQKDGEYYHVVRNIYRKVAQDLHDI